MEAGSDLIETAQLFKTLGHESRLELLILISARPSTVGSLAEVTGMSQPLVSQHLRTLRQVGLVVATKTGKEVIYRLVDPFVIHVISEVTNHYSTHR